MNKNKIREAFEGIVYCLDREEVPQHKVDEVHRIACKILAALDDDGWVKCDERLPAKEGLYLCAIDVTPLNWAEGQKAPYEQRVVYFRRERFNDDAIEYWRELPPPPEEDDG